MKTRVIMIGQNEYKDWEMFEEGYIDGYMRGGDNKLMPAAKLCRIKLVLILKPMCSVPIFLK